MLTMVSDALVWHVITLSVASRLSPRSEENSWLLPPLPTQPQVMPRSRCIACTISTSRAVSSYALECLRPRCGGVGASAFSVGASGCIVSIHSTSR
eukprot:1760989-Prymnesium_polylepis.1